MTPAWNWPGEMGASRTYNFTRYADLNELLDAVKRTTAAAWRTSSFSARA